MGKITGEVRGIAGVYRGIVKANGANKGALAVLDKIDKDAPGHMIHDIEADVEALLP